MAVREAFGGVFKGRTVLVTGHTGFKGSWLSIWLHELGAQVIGYSLSPPTEPSNFCLSHLEKRIIDLRGDVRDLEGLREAIQRHQPEVAFHLAAQPLVRLSYHEPKETLDVNVGGTVNVLEATRTTACIRALVCITTDKVYRNREWLWGYREDDELGGHDPYSASKAMAELAVSTYRQSFYPPDRYAKHGVAVASARAGNVIGGGDWGQDRLVPDCMRAWTAGQPLHLRNPGFVRPWQLLLEPLSGYLWLAAQMLGPDGGRFAEAWNFGPLERRGVTTEEFVQQAIDLWGAGSYTTGISQNEVETALLRLNWDKAAHRLKWQPVYGWQEALAQTIDWYRQHYASPAIDMYGACVEQIQVYVAHARQLGLPWAGPGAAG
jgi:CDP-glucose 4,6-dehydratase